MSNVTNMINQFVRGSVSEDIQRSLFKIDNATIFDDCYRVNVWTRTTSEDRVVPSFNIAESFFVEVVDGKIVDRTIR